MKPPLWKRRFGEEIWKKVALSKDKRLRRGGQGESSAAY